MARGSFTQSPTPVIAIEFDKHFLIIDPERPGALVRLAVVTSEAVEAAADAPTGRTPPPICDEASSHLAGFALTPATTRGHTPAPTGVASEPHAEAPLGVRVSFLAFAAALGMTRLSRRGRS